MDGLKERFYEKDKKCERRKEYGSKESGRVGGTHKQRLR